jgi:DNA (cytosine-5)-methyltransferase 1
MRKIKVADLFCGAGGSSTGAKQAIEGLGREMELVCVNHWDRAIETHKRMHPEARHYCQDVASARPIECVPEGRLDLLMASPTCTYHSRARGGRPTSDQQRMDPWHVVTWLTELKVDRLLIENVPEFVDWGPVDPRTGRPIKAKKGQYFREWIATLQRLDYRVDWKVLNCADYGDATTRRRFFLMGRKRGRLKWPAPTHTKEPGHDLLAPLQRWRPARECIEWSLKGRSIFGRKHPLAPRTIQRIYAGAMRFNWPEPFLVVLRQHMAVRSIDLALPTIAANGRHIGLATPIIVGNGGAEYAGKPKSVEDPISTVLTQDRRGLATPVLIRSDAHGARKLRARSPDEPVQTIVGSGGIGIAEPFMVPVTHHGTFRGQALGEPFPTVTGAHRGEQALIEPFVLSQASGGAPRPVSQPFPTITTGGRQGEGTALISPYYGSGSGKTCKSVEDPLDTVTVQDRFGLICPVTHGGGGPLARDIGAPLPTLTTSKGGHLAFITASFGERDGQLPRVHDLELPMPTIPAQGSVRMAAASEGEGEQQYDILFRMLHWRELARAMSFSDADSDYEFAGTKTEITKQIGNAVPVRTARALVAAALWDVAG